MQVLLLFSLLIGIGSVCCGSTKFEEPELVTLYSDGSACTNNETSCELASGRYACCPYHDAVCCSDHTHCCPNNHKCDIEHGHCKRDIEQLKDVPCPDGETACPDGHTCCQLDDGGYGCCPLEAAVCCSDHLHCCPTHYKCDLHIFKCDHDQFGSIPLFKKEVAQKKISSKLNPSLKSSLDISTIVCPDENYCPDETTCCQLKNDTYGCCPYENGNCCSDQIHCCGNGYACDESGTRCIRHFQSKKVAPMARLVNDVIKEDLLCPDGITKCFSNSTCCPNKDSSYSCCPYSKGVCCGTNGSVCCPNDYDCNQDQLSCELRDSFVKRQLLSEAEYYQCGSSNIFCFDQHKCCHTNGASNYPYKCCPYKEGHCCSDGKHCCPQGMTCELEFHFCMKI